MAVNLNLLPQELAVGGDLSRVLKGVRALSVIALAAFILFVVGAGAFFLISSAQLNSLNAANDQLSVQIKNEESTEQKLVLLKDRAAKVKQAYAVASVTKSVDVVIPLFSTLPPGATLNEINIDPNKITASILFKSTADVTNFFEQLRASSSFSLATLTSFGFNPATGYLVSISLVPK